MTAKHVRSWAAVWPTVFHPSWPRTVNAFAQVATTTQLALHAIPAQNVSHSQKDEASAGWGRKCIWIRYSLSSCLRTYGQARLETLKFTSNKTWIDKLLKFLERYIHLQLITNAFSVLLGLLHVSLCGLRLHHIHAISLRVSRLLWNSWIDFVWDIYSTNILLFFVFYLTVLKSWSAYYTGPATQQTGPEREG